MLEQALERWFGFTAFKTGQKEVIELLIQGQSAAAIFPTGSGKSLCYQLPAMLLPHLTLVVSPLLALMKDQVDFLISRRIPAARLDSTLPPLEYNDILAKAKNNEIKILMISVERFKNERFRYHLEKMKISLLVVDEAHCISEWGHNFRPEYLKLPFYAEAYGLNRILLLTATATPAVIDDMCGGFGFARKNVVTTGFYRPNLFLRVFPVKEEEKAGLLAQRIKSAPKAPTIVYATLQNSAEALAQFLRDQGVEAACYHAGMSNEAREAVQNRFMTGALDCVTATIAFGMGIDKSDIRRVIHFDLPKSIENYSQEIGRSGRDGRPAECEVFANQDNLCVLENFVYGDTPEREAVAKLLTQIKYAPDSVWDVKLNTISFDVNIRILPLKTLLVYLEMAGILRSKYTYFERYAFEFIETAEAIRSRFQGERRQFVDTLFKYCITKRVWTHVDVDAVCTAYSADRNRVLAALTYFEEKGWIRLQTGQSTERYDILNQDFQIDRLADDIYRRFKEKERKEIDRIHQMVGFFQNRECLSRALASYFGESLPMARCGHCSVCAGSPVEKLPAAELPSLAEMNFSSWVQEVITLPEFQCSALLIAKYLCGIQTPLFMRLKIKKSHNFGVLVRYPFERVLAWAVENTAGASANRGE